MEIVTKPIEVNPISEAWRSEDFLVMSVFRKIPQRVKNQTRKQKFGDTYFCARRIVERLYAETTKRLNVAKRKGVNKRKR